MLDLTTLFPKTSQHYFWEIYINNKKVTVVVDTGSNSTILSKGACKKLGINVIKNSAPSIFTGVEGQTTAYEGKTERVVITLHKQIEFDVPYLKVSNNPGFLIILGNDLLGNH